MENRKRGKKAKKKRRKRAKEGLPLIIYFKKYYFDLE